MTDIKTRFNKKIQLFWKSQITFYFFHFPKNFSFFDKLSAVFFYNTQTYIMEELAFEGLEEEPEEVEEPFIGPLIEEEVEEPEEEILIEPIEPLKVSKKHEDVARALKMYIMLQLGLDLDLILPVSTEQVDYSFYQSLINIFDLDITYGELVTYDIADVKENLYPNSIWKTAASLITGVPELEANSLSFYESLSLDRAPFKALYERYVESKGIKPKKPTSYYIKRALRETVALSVAAERYVVTSKVGYVKPFNYGEEPEKYVDLMNAIRPIINDIRNTGIKKILPTIEEAIKNIETTEAAKRIHKKKEEKKEHKAIVKKADKAEKELRAKEVLLGKQPKLRSIYAKEQPKSLAEVLETRILKEKSVGKQEADEAEEESKKLASYDKFVKDAVATSYLSLYRARPARRGAVSMTSTAYQWKGDSPDIKKTIKELPHDIQEEMQNAQKFGEPSHITLISAITAAIIDNKDKGQATISISLRLLYGRAGKTVEETIAAGEEPEMVPLDIPILKILKHVMPTAFLGVTEELIPGLTQEELQLTRRRLETIEAKKLWKEYTAVEKTGLIIKYVNDYLLTEIANLTTDSMRQQWIDSVELETEQDQIKVLTTWFSLSLKTIIDVSPIVGKGLELFDINDLFDEDDMEVSGSITAKQVVVGDIVLNNYSTENDDDCLIRTIRGKIAEVYMFNKVAATSRPWCLRKQIRIVRKELSIQQGPIVITDDVLNKISDYYRVSIDVLTINDTKDGLNIAHKAIYKLAECDATNLVKHIQIVVHGAHVYGYGGIRKNKQCVLKTIMHIFYDYETIFDSGRYGMECAYSVQIALCDNKYNLIEFKPSEVISFTEYSSFKYGVLTLISPHNFDCNDKLIQYYIAVRHAYPSTKIIMHAFNGSRFDFYLTLYAAGSRCEVMPIIPVIAGNSILTLGLNGEETSSFDLIRHLDNSLATCISDWNITLDELYIIKNTSHDSLKIAENTTHEDDKKSCVREKIAVCVTKKEIENYKKLVDHRIIQDEAMSMRLSEYLEKNRTACELYGIIDVLSLIKLTMKYEEVAIYFFNAANIKLNKSCDSSENVIFDFPTRGTVSDLFQKTFLKKRDLKTLIYRTISQENEVNKCCVAGRSDFFVPQGVYIFPYTCIDVVSLYPTVMRSCNYVLKCKTYRSPLENIYVEGCHKAGTLLKKCVPTNNKSVHECVDESVNDMHGLNKLSSDYILKYLDSNIGLYNVIVTKHPVDISNKPVAAIARRCWNGSLDWLSPVPFMANTDSITLYTHIKYGGECIINYGYCYPTSTDKMFTDYVNIFSKIKEEQDHFKETGSSEYNPGIRTYSKAILNGRSGKEKQRKFTNSAKFVQEEDKLQCSGIPMDGLYAIKRLPSGCGVIAMYRKKTETGSRRSQLNGGLIYAHSRRLMFETVYTKCPSRVMTETDSCIISVGDYDRLDADSSLIELLRAKDECGLPLRAQCGSQLNNSIRSIVYKKGDKRRHFGMFDDEIMGEKLPKMWKDLFNKEVCWRVGDPEHIKPSTLGIGCHQTELEGDTFSHRLWERNIDVSSEWTLSPWMTAIIELGKKCYCTYIYNIHTKERIEMKAKWKGISPNTVFLEDSSNYSAYDQYKNIKGGMYTPQELHKLFTYLHIEKPAGNLSITARRRCIDHYFNLLRDKESYCIGECIVKEARWYDGIVLNETVVANAPVSVIEEIKNKNIDPTEIGRNIWHKNLSIQLPVLRHAYIPRVVRLQDMDISLYRDKYNDSFVYNDQVICGEQRTKKNSAIKLE